LRVATFEPAVAVFGRSGYGRPMAVKLYRCSSMWVKIDAHPCWRVQKALDEQGIEYEVVKGPLRGGKRDQLEQLSGQRKYPVIEFENGSVYRAESSEMAARIRAGELVPDGADGAPGGSAPAH
jgi:glutaredoxin